MLEVSGLFANVFMMVSFQLNGAALYERPLAFFLTQGGTYMNLATSNEVDMGDAIWILESEAVSVSFDTKGYSFYKGGTGILGSPVENQLRLIAVKGERKIRIEDVLSLKGRVVIKTPVQALEFVRLFTSIQTHFLLPDSSYIEPRLTHSSIPGVGEYTSKYKNMLDIQTEELERDNGVFVIKRNLVEKTGKLYRVTEHVTEDGAYTLKEKVLVDSSTPIVYPIYE